MTGKQAAAARVGCVVSWDVLFQSLPAGIASIDDVPADFEPAPLGVRAEIIAKLVARLPGVDFSDPSWGMLLGETFSIEFNLGGEDVADSLMLHVRGGDEALGVVREVSEALGVPAIDCSEGELIDFTSPDAARGFAAWRAFRDRVVRSRMH